MRLLGTLVALCVALVATGAARVLANAPSKDYARAPQDLVQRFDGNGDGRVVQDEFVAYLSLGFRARDVDGNGVLEGEELPPGARPIGAQDNIERLRRQFNRQDANGDGHLDAGELLAPPRA